MLFHIVITSLILFAPADAVPSTPKHKAASHHSHSAVAASHSIKSVSGRNSLQFHKDAASGDAFDMLWSSERDNSTSVEMVMTVGRVNNGKVADVGAWMGVGFGKNMRTTEHYLICRIDDRGTISQYIGKGVGHHAPNLITPELITSTSTSKPIKASGTRNISETAFACKWYIDFSEMTEKERNRVIWAYSIPPARSGNWFMYHDGKRGAHRMDWMKGAGRIIAVNDTSGLVKKVHAVGMGVVWMLLFPGVTLYSRYTRPMPKKVIVHIVMQSTGVLLALAFVGIVFTFFRNPTSAHGGLGIFLIIAILLQASVGVLNRLKMNTKVLRPYYKLIKYGHANMGFAIIIIAVVQTFLGLNLLYPWLDNRGREFWYLHIVITALWLLIFGFCEYRLNNRITKLEGNYTPLSAEKGKQLPVDVTDNSV